MLLIFANKYVSLQAFLILYLYGNKEVSTFQYAYCRQFGGV